MVFIVSVVFSSHSWNTAGSGVGSAHLGLQERAEASRAGSCECQVAGKKVNSHKDQASGTPSVKSARAQVLVRLSPLQEGALTSLGAAELPGPGLVALSAQPLCLHWFSFS